MESKLWKAVKARNISEARECLRLAPGLPVNWKNEVYLGWTSLHTACWEGLVELVQLLLAHPNIDVNTKASSYNQTPLALACSNGKVDVVKVLLRDPRVSLNDEDSAGKTPLKHAAANKYVEVVKWMIASGREVLLETAKEKKEEDFGLQVLERFLKNPQETRAEVRRELGIPRKDDYFLIGC